MPRIREDNPYKGYIHSAEPKAIAETRRALLLGDRWRTAGRDSAKRFREEMNVSKIRGPVVARTLTTMN